jgi:hypothetical protein
MVSWARMKARSASLTSQRWVAPPDLMATRPPSSLEHNGGEYLNLYWSSGTPDEMHGQPIDSDRRGAYASWHQSVHIPMVLDSGVFSGAVKLMSDAEEDRNLHVVLYYTDRPDPAVAYTEFQQIANGWKRSGKDFPEGDSVRKLIHSGMYRPSIGHYEFYD